MAGYSFLFHSQTGHYLTNRSQGLMPVCFLKAVLKCDMLE